MNTRLAAIALTFVVALHAQEFAPDLAPSAAKYRADTAALETQKAAAIARAK
jgi:hypothetical protein